MVLSDLREHIPDEYFESETERFNLNESFDKRGFLSKELRWGYLAGDLGRRLCFSNEILMSAKQKSAAEVLMNLGMYVAAKAAHEACDKIQKLVAEKEADEGNAGEVARQLQTKQLPVLEKNVTGSLKQYIRYLSNEEAKPFVPLLSDKDQIELGFKKSIKNEVLQWSLKKLDYIFGLLLAALFAYFGLK
ncbi:hypothetical protein C8R11_101162 [Nitrosomonas aestuarii]|nr:hypothetical protein C8R11_101162 [Nitrosomonas aestuarii]